MGRGVHRGFITHEELNKSLGKRNLSDKNLEQAFIHIFDEKITLVEKKSDFYKDALIQVPVLATKAWTSSISLKMCDLDLKELSKYKITDLPCLVLFTNEKLKKIVV